MHLKRFLEPTLWAVWGLLVGGAALWVAVGSIGFFSKSGWLPSDSSGWIQAMGSVVAIFVAIYIASSESRRLKKERTEHERVLISGLISMTHNAALAVERLHANISPNSRSAEDVAYVESSLASFMSIDLLKLPSEKTLIEVLKVRSTLEVALQKESLCHGLIDQESAKKEHAFIKEASTLIYVSSINLQVLRTHVN
ncbi:hypothetical protein ACIQYF_13910 [Pseudomonas sp. NPDC096917]|uniref:hypothetical protein n=1 Tax=Pseudomonas sp. NPDC096917 TaxID=3364483 RepID=UPI00383B89B1